MFCPYNKRNLFHSFSPKISSFSWSFSSLLLYYLLLLSSFDSKKEFWTIPRKLANSLLWYAHFYMALEIVVLFLLMTLFSIACHYPFLGNTSVLLKSLPLFLNDMPWLILCSSFQCHSHQHSSSYSIYFTWLLVDNMPLLTHREWSVT